MKPTEIDLSELPFVPLERRSDLPEIPCIYFAIGASQEILYIGRAKNARRRWRNHHRLSDVEQIKGVKLAYLQIDDTELLPRIEESMIEWFRPHLNKTKTPRKLIKNRRKPASIQHSAGIEPRTFIEKWKISRTELAQLTSTSESTVNQWLSKDPKQEPHPVIPKLLKTIDSVWEVWQGQRESQRKFQPVMVDLFKVAITRKAATIN